MDGLEWLSSKKLVLGELIKGREFAHKLQTMLQKQVIDQDGSSSSVSSAQELVMNILRSFSDTLSALSSDSDEVGRQISAVGYVGSACSVDRKPECSGESRKSPAAGKDRRGCYKRRKKSDTRINVAPVIDDEYAWRKYGQKEILNAKFPRCYFRCTHKYDQGCKAVKQVQRMEDDSNLYQITYFGHHTCKTILKPTQMFQEPDHLVNSYLLSFESKDQYMTCNTMKRDDRHCSTNNVVSAVFAPLVKQEPKQLLEQSTTTTHHELSDDNLSCADSNLWKEIIALGSSDRQNDHDHSIMGFDHHDHDVVSSVQYSDASTSSHGFDMEFLFKSVDDQFEGEFPFGEME